MPPPPAIAPSTPCSSETLQRAGRRDRVAFVQDVGAGARPGARADRADRQPARRRARRSRLSCLRSAGRRRATGGPAGWRSTADGRLVNAGRRQALLDDGGNPDHAAGGRARRSPSPATAPSPGAPVTDRADRNRDLRPTSGRCRVLATVCDRRRCRRRPTSGSRHRPGRAGRLQRPAGPGDDDHARHRARVRGCAATPGYRARARAAGDRAHRFAPRVNHVERSELGKGW